jgi:hypothetical protein
MMSAISDLGMSGVSTLQRPQALTDDQKKQIQDILSQYDPSNLTAEDAKSIFKAFKDAGIRPGPGMKDAITAAGFDAEKLFSLGGHKGHHRHGSESSSSAAQGESGINVSALQQLQTLLNQYDLTNLSADQQQNLETQLGQAGLLTSGNTINVGI